MMPPRQRHLTCRLQSKNLAENVLEKGDNVHVHRIWHAKQAGRASKAKLQEVSAATGDFGSLEKVARKGIESVLPSSRDRAKL